MQRTRRERQDGIRMAEEPMGSIELGKYLDGAPAEYRACMEACIEGVVACEICAIACLGEDQVEHLRECIRLCMDCAETCATCVRILARQGETAQDVCRACAEICELCAAACGKHQDEHCQRCAEACRRCAAECRAVAAAAA
jgi:hypothetical protein